MKTIIVKAVMIAAAGLMLASCSHYQPLKAPCTYNNRNRCGTLVPMTPPPNPAA